MTTTRKTVRGLIGDNGIQAVKPVLVVIGGTYEHRSGERMTVASADETTVRHADGKATPRFVFDGLLGLGHYRLL